MAIIRRVGRTLRGISLVLVLAVLFCGVLIVSCLARLFLGCQYSEVAGKLHPGA
jgi:hypothetical protein